MSRTRKPRSKVIEESGVRVRIYERKRGAPIYREVRGENGKDRRSFDHCDWQLAEQQARALARRLGELRLAGHVPGGVTLGQLTRLYFLHRAPLLSAERRGRAEMHSEFFLRHLGDDFQLENLSQTHVDAFVAARRSGALASPRRRGEVKTVRDGTVRQNCNWLAALIHWGRSFKVNGRRLLASDPMDGITLVRERNPRRPIASEDRYRKTMAKADVADPRGRLRAILALARYTGRRINAICQLRASDVLLSRDAVLRTLAATGQDERLADYMPHGAIRWRAETDKCGYEELTALSLPARAELEHYVKANPRVGEAPLFPATEDASRPAGKLMAEYWLLRAETLAGLPKLDRGVWHPYRRLWAMERKELPDVDVAKAGGWRDLSTMKRSYQQPDPATVLRVIENTPAPATPSSDIETSTSASAS
jgi:integrase